MLSVYPGMSLDMNFSQAVPSTHGFSRGVPPPPTTTTTTTQYDPYNLASFSASSGVSSPALFDTQCSSYGFPVTSAGATHAAAFMPSPPQPFLPQQQPQSSSRTLASGSPASMQYSPVPFDQQLGMCTLPGQAPKLMAEDYAQPESGLPVDPCVYSRSSCSPLAGPVAAPPPPPTLSPTISFHHSGYHPYMYPGNVFFCCSETKM
ncbi:hypothetical protein BJV82DRAFT_4187 [Fennellomyces sp. T-0311]|nr:hypothetical protein BJV82DRAFT_4187 [Fennellomyces sp. T-0311]